MLIILFWHCIKIKDKGICPWICLGMSSNLAAVCEYLARKINVVVVFNDLSKLWVRKTNKSFFVCMYVFVSLYCYTSLCIYLSITILLNCLDIEPKKIIASERLRKIASRNFLLLFQYICIVSTYNINFHCFFSFVYSPFYF